jgi:hypothetical protein
MSAVFDRIFTLHDRQFNTESAKPGALQLISPVAMGSSASTESRRCDIDH